MSGQVNTVDILRIMQTVCLFNNPVDTSNDLRINKFRVRRGEVW